MASSGMMSVRLVYIREEVLLNIIYVNAFSSHHYSRSPIYDSLVNMNHICDCQYCNNFADPSS